MIVVMARKKNKKNKEGEGGNQGEREETTPFKSLMAVTSIP
jgi:hypothetical protein